MNNTIKKFLFHTLLCALFMAATPIPFLWAQTAEMAQPYAVPMQPTKASTADDDFWSFDSAESATTTTSTATQSSAKASSGSVNYKKLGKVLGILAGITAVVGSGIWVVKRHTDKKAASDDEDDSELKKLLDPKTVKSNATKAASGAESLIGLPEDDRGTLVNATEASVDIARTLFQVAQKAAKNESIDNANADELATKFVTAYTTIVGAKKPLASAAQKLSTGDVKQRRLNYQEQQLLTKTQATLRKRILQPATLVTQHAAGLVATGPKLAESFGNITTAVSQGESLNAADVANAVQGVKKVIAAASDVQKGVGTLNLVKDLKPVLKMIHEIDPNAHLRVMRELSTLNQGRIDPLKLLKIFEPIIGTPGPQDLAALAGDNPLAGFTHLAGGLFQGQ